MAGSFMIQTHCRVQLSELVVFGFWMWIFEYFGGESLFSIEIMTHIPSFGKMAQWWATENSNMSKCLSTDVTTQFLYFHWTSLQASRKYHNAFRVIGNLLLFCNSHNHYTVHHCMQLDLDFNIFYFFISTFITLNLPT